MRNPANAPSSSRASPTLLIRPPRSSVKDPPGRRAASPEQSDTGWPRRRRGAPRRASPARPATAGRRRRPAPAHQPDPRSPARRTSSIGSSIDASSSGRAQTTLETTGTAIKAKPETSAEAGQQAERGVRRKQVRQIAVSQECVESIEPRERDQRPARQTQRDRLAVGSRGAVPGRPAARSRRENRGRCRPFALRAATARRPGRRYATAAARKRRSAERAASPFTDLRSARKAAPSWSRGDRARRSRFDRVDAQLAQGAALVGRQLVFRQRIFRMGEQLGAKRWICDGAL